MRRFVHRRNQWDKDIFENVLNSYIQTDVLRSKCCTCCNCSCCNNCQKLGTILKKEDPKRFIEYFDLWVEEASKSTDLINKTRSSNILKRYEWNKDIDIEIIKHQGVKALRQLGIV